ncbi:MAG: hypothetical protein AAFP84_20125 [Actinomycetota bacterium]
MNHLARRCLALALPLAAVVSCGSDDSSSPSVADTTVVEVAPLDDTSATDAAPDDSAPEVEADLDESDDAAASDDAVDAATEPEAPDADDTTVADDTAVADDTTGDDEADANDAESDAGAATEVFGERGRPAAVEDSIVVAFGSNVWPVVEDLLVVGIAPDVIVRNEGSQDAPAYLIERFGEEIGAAAIMEMNLLNPSIEAFAAIGGDVLAVPREFEPFLPAELVDLFDLVVFTKLDDWRLSVGTIVDTTGADAEILDELEAVYAARVAEVQAATALDLASLSISTFAINGEQASPDSRQGPGARAAIALGLQPIEVMLDVPNRENPSLSLEELTSLDADLVFYNVRSQTELDELLADPLWQQTSAFANETTYPGVSEWRQSGFLGTLFVLDELEAALLDVEARGVVGS